MLVDNPLRQPRTQGFISTGAEIKPWVRGSVLPTLGFYPKILGFSWDFYFKNKTLGFFLGFFRIQKIILNINFLILIDLLVRESYPVINIIR